MKDQQGIERGACEDEICMCVEYVKPKGTDQKCDYCEHYPVKHKPVIVVKQSSSPPSPPIVSPASSSGSSMDDCVIDEKKDKKKKEEESPVYTPPSVPKAQHSTSDPAVAVSSRVIHKKGLLQDLKNPKKFIHEKRKKKKA